jgi:hypothetical protein
MVTSVVIATRVVATSNVAVAAPGGTVSDEGTVAAVPLAVSEIATPVDGAGALSVTVARAIWPPRTEASTSSFDRAAPAGAVEGGVDEGEGDEGEDGSPHATTVQSRQTDATRRI